MLFDTSHKNEEYIKESNKLLGKTFLILEKIKMRGVGSGRLIIEKICSELKPKNMQTIDISYASIELRPKGIVIHFSNRLDRYSWVIPYYRLVIFNTEILSIHSNGKFIQFKKDKNYQGNKKFIKKMMALKNTFLEIN